MTWVEIILHSCIFAASLAGLFCFLDRLIKHFTIAAISWGCSELTIGFLTSVIGWEQLLATLSLAINNDQPSLALGNIIGSSITNILGAFSLVIVFHKGTNGILFGDKNTEQYTLALSAATLLVFGILITTPYATIPVEVFYIFLIMHAAVYAILVLLRITEECDPIPEVQIVYRDCIYSALSSGESVSTFERPTYEDYPSPVPTSPSSPGSPKLDSRDGSPLSTLNERDEQDDAALADSTVISPATSQDSHANPAEADSEPAHDSIVDIPDSNAVSSDANPQDVSLVSESGTQIRTHLCWAILSLVLSSICTYIISWSTGHLLSIFSRDTITMGVFLSIRNTISSQVLAIVAARGGNARIIVGSTIGLNYWLLLVCFLFVVGNPRDHMGRPSPVEYIVFMGSAAAMMGIIFLGKVERWMGIPLFVVWLVFFVFEAVLAVLGRIERIK
ncbi:hypothetical protein SBOR_3189 [Sclerotinia borealis F-4128]|uniref:Sodium/calcium exchanger membrane region domain-containing protein n=1 Tax=Sclerotinia borealis (strain F-4128) TaxID=1432307 RepID=W9CI80_SCLBF|nr:hypothetical protein SBOR_3189 [Sclerotinia borealis F-4128]